MSERYQREIEEILGQINQGPQYTAKPRTRGFGRKMLSAIGQFLGGRSWSLSPGRIMVGSLVLLLVAAIFRTSMPGLVAPIAWAAVVVFILGYALFFINPQPSHEKRWRGRLIETPPSWWERIIHRTKDRHD